MSKPIAIGIDLGTTNCCVAKYISKEDDPKILENIEGKFTTPSYVTFRGGEILIGDPAKSCLIKTNTIIINNIKRLIGRKITEVEDREYFPYKIIEEDGRIKIPITIDGVEKTLFPEQLSALLLNYLRENAERKLGTQVIDAVITVPAYFNNSQRQATKLAAKIAGLNVLRIVNEPTAAAIAYCHYNIKNAMNTTKSNEKNILVYDLGGGTFDVSIININGKSLKVLAVGGDDHLGGEDFTNAMLDYCIDYYNETKTPGIDSMDYRQCARLRNKCEKVKIELSSSEITECTVENFVGEIDFVLPFTRKIFEALNIEEFQRTIDIMNECIDDAKIDKDKIDKVILIGGSTRIPKVQQLLSHFFARDIVNHTMNPDHGVAQGAAILAAHLQENPKLSDFKLGDVIPKSLGKHVHEEKMSILIRRNTPIPVKVTKQYKTTKDNQTQIDVKIYEGGSKFVEDNNLLDMFVIKDLTPELAGVVKHDVTFYVDKNGILNVESKEIGKNASPIGIKIDDSKVWSDEDIINLRNEIMIQRSTH